MDKHIAVPEYVLESIIKTFGEDHELIKNYAIVWLLKNGTKVPVEVLPNITKRDLLEEVVGKDNTSEIDYALPQQLVDRVQEVIGFNIVPHFCMDCRTINFQLLPITSIGKAVLPIIKKIILGEN
jgi:hypothetical protein